jgi:hypothetical protein
MADPVSWYAIESGWRVTTRDGAAVGQVTDVLGDEELDIFNGLVVGLGVGRRLRYASADLVSSIETGTVMLELPPDEATSLPEWDE